MPEWFQDEGIDAVLDRVQRIGADAIATSPYVLERVAQGDGAREPPPDGEAGKVRPLDRPLFGATELWVRTSPAFVHDVRRYAGLRYQPAPPTAVTHANATLIDDVVAAATRRGLRVYLQVMAASPPGYRVQFSAAVAEDRCAGPDFLPHEARVDRNASLASDAVGAYVATLLAELAERYPGVAGFRLDWPEYPPYDLGSALFDFNPCGAGADGGAPGTIRREVAAAARAWRLDARAAIASLITRRRGARASAALAPAFDALLAPRGALAALFDAKRAAVRALLARCRRALDAVPGPRRRLEPQVFPPPFGRLSGFPLDALDGPRRCGRREALHDALADDRRATGRATSSASAEGRSRMRRAWRSRSHFGLLDALPADAATFRYPEPAQAHPAGANAQRAKLAAARRAAGDVPVIAFAHSYGPQDDVLARFAIAARRRRPGVDQPLRLPVRCEARRASRAPRTRHDDHGPRAESRHDRRPRRALRARRAAAPVLERLCTGALWSEGPVWMHEDDSVLWSDIHNNRMLRWSDADGLSRVARAGRVHEWPHARPRRSLLHCSHGLRAVVRTRDGRDEIVVDRYEGKRLNSPNDIVVASDGAIWFTDPPYGILLANEGHPAPIRARRLLRVPHRPVSGALAIVSDLPEHPNGLAFSPDETRLYVSDTSAALATDGGGNHCLWVFDVVDGRRLENGRALRRRVARPAGRIPLRPARAALHELASTACRCTRRTARRSAAFPFPRRSAT